MLSEAIINRLKALQRTKLSERSPVWVDIFSKSNTVLDTTYAAYLATDIDCEKFSNALLYVEATFGASANKDIYVDLLAVPPGGSGYSSEPIARAILAYNTVSPYKRYFWLPVDIKYVSKLAIYVTQTGAAAASTLTHVGLRLVV